jgi:tRNA A-37 threonylcarbamoyl transferase component Bud32
LHHGHLNSRNIFFDSDNGIEIADFGAMSKEVEENESDGYVGVRGF